MPSSTESRPTTPTPPTPPPVRQRNWPGNSPRPASLGSTLALLDKQSQPAARSSVAEGEWSKGGRRLRMGRIGDESVPGPVHGPGTGRSRQGRRAAISASKNPLVSHRTQTALDATVVPALPNWSRHLDVSLGG